MNQGGVGVWSKRVFALLVVAALASCRTKSEGQEPLPSELGPAPGVSRATLPVESLAPACAGVLPETVNPSWRLGGLSVPGGEARTETFAASDNLDALVVLQNGDGRGTGRAQSATVSLNGVAVGTLSAGQDLKVFRVTLSATNQLTVEAQGDGRVRVSVATLGTLPCMMADTGYLQPGHAPSPAVVDFEPKGAGTLGVLVVDMLGETVDAQVRLNGVEVLAGVPPSQRRVHATAISLNSTNRLEVLVQGDSDSNVRVAIFDADTLPTALSFTEPEDGAYVTSSPVVASGRYGSDGKSLVVNGTPAWLVGSDGFRSDVPLVEGVNSITAVMADSCGNVSRVCRAVVLDQNAPVITVRGVSDGDVTRGPVTVEWEAVSPYVVNTSATLNGVAIANNTEVSADGEYELLVTAQDPEGRVAMKRVRFTLLVRVPVITVAGISEGEFASRVVTPSIQVDSNYLEALIITLNSVGHPNNTPIHEDGTYSLYVVAKDRAANYGIATVNFTIDRTFPLVALSGVAEGAVLNGPVVVSYTAKDLNMAAEGVEALLDGQEYRGGDTISAEGRHTVKVTARDKADNRTVSTVSFTLDFTPPLLVVDGVPEEGLVARVVTPVFSATDANPGSVSATLGGTPFVSGTAVGDDGAYLLEIRAEDQAGNVTSTVRSFVIDRTPPVVTVEGVDEGELRRTPATISWTVADAHPGTVSATLDGAPLTSGSTVSASGAHVLVITATDLVGNVREERRNFVLDAVPPVVTIRKPVNGLVTREAQVEVEVEVVDESLVESVLVGGEELVRGPDGLWRRTHSLLEGTNLLVVTVMDAAGNTSTQSVSVIRNSEEPGDGGVGDGGTPDGGAGQDAGTPPRDAGVPSRDAGAMDGSDAGSVGNSDAGAGVEPAPVLVVEAPQEGGVYGGAHVVVRGRIEGGTLPLTVTVQGVGMAVNGREFTGALSLADGDYSLQFRVTDARGRSQSQTRTVAIDRLPPQLSLTPPSSGWDRIAQSPYLLMGTVGDRHLSEVLVDGVPVRVVAGAFSAYVTLPPQVPTQVNVVARDVAGNRTQQMATLTLRGSAPRVAILEPSNGFEAPNSEVTVRVRVTSAAPLRSLRIGTESLDVSSAREEYTTTVRLSLGENVIHVTAEDTQVSEGALGGMVGAASVTVRYRDASQEPLSVTGVSPRGGAQGIEPDSLVSVSFNKPIRGTALAERFQVHVNGEGAALPGGYSVAPGGQTVSFIARDPLPEGARLRVLVKNLEPVTLPGMGNAEFSSEFTVRRPLTRVRGYVVDADYRPLPGVKVSVEGTTLSTVSGPDGNWTLFPSRGGELALRYEGGVTSEGQSFPSVRRRLFAQSEADTLDAPLALTAVDTASAQVVDALRPMSMDFAGRHRGLRVDVPAEGFFFEDGATRGLVTATEVQPYALPLPMEGRAGLGALWQMGPAGLRLQKAVSVTFPNRTNLPAGRLAMVLGHDPQRHQLKRVGFARVSADATVLNPLSPLGLTSLEFVGYVPLDEVQHQAVAVALGLDDAGGDAGQPLDGGSGLRGSRGGVRPVRSSEPLWKQFLSNFAVTEAHAQLGGGVNQAGYTAFDTLAGMAIPGAVTGSVRAPLERQLELEVSRPTLPGQGAPASEQTVTLPYSLALDFRSRFVSMDPYEVANPETVLVTLTAEGPQGPLPEPTPGAWQAQGVGEAAVAQDVALPEGRTVLTLSALSKSSHRLLKLEAELVREPGDAGPARAKLRLRTLQDTFSDVGDEAVHSPVRFKNLRVTVTGPGGGSVGMTGASGGFGIPVAGLTGGEMGIACTEVPTGPRLVERLGDDGVIRYTPTLNQFPVCSQTFTVSPGSSARADILVDVRMLYGALTFVNRRGESLGLNCDEDAYSQRAQTPGEFVDIALRDVKSTEVHFFREDDLEHPIATFAAGTPNGAVCSQGSYQPGDPHGYYTRVRTGPAARIRQVARERCRELERELGTSDGGGLSDADQGYYDGNCRDNRTNHLRLNPGDRLVVFAVNHATGYSGMAHVTVPAVNRVERSASGACQADDEAGGPLQVTELGETMTLSRCTQAELGIPADLKLYPPELDIRVSRRLTPEGVQVAARPSLVRHGGAGTTKDDFLQLDTHWRVRQLPEVATDGGVGSDAGVVAHVDAGPDEASCVTVGYLPDGGICEPGMLRDLGAPGEALEQFCSELPASSPHRLLGRCDMGTPRVVDVPPGVPAIAGRVVRVTGTAEEQPVVVTFPVRPGRHTASVQTPLTYVNGQGQTAILGALPRANYYLHVVGHPMLERDRNDDGFLQPDEVNAPPPNFCEPGECKNRDGMPESEPGTGEHPESLPKWAVGLKNVYRHREENGSALERYDRAREHEFRVLELGAATIVAEGGEHVQLDGGSADGGRVLAGTRPEATDDDVAYQFLLNGLQTPDVPGRAGTVSGEYRLRLGTDDFGIECPVAFNPEQRTISGTCDGEYLPEVLSAADILYFELYLSGNADNVLYRFNFHGISPRTDFVTAGSEDTQVRSLARATPSALSSQSATSRPISVKAMAQFAIEPDVMTEGTIRLCEGTECTKDTLLKAAEVRYVRNEATGAGKYQVVRYLDEADADISQPLIIQAKPGANGAGRFALPLANHLGRMQDMRAQGREVVLTLEPKAGPTGVSKPMKQVLGEPVGRYTFVNAMAAGQTVFQGVNLAGGHLRVTHEDFSVPHLAEAVSFSRTFNNQNNEVSPLGVGWTHDYEGFVVEEELGRYIVVLNGQSYDFPVCATVNQAGFAASDCSTDKSHGGRLTVDVDGAEFTTSTGMVYRFKTESVLATGIPDQRRWVLTEFSDGQGTDEPKQGWTMLTYVPGSDLVASVSRAPGHVTLVFEYKDADVRGNAEKLRLLARSRNLKLMSAVGLYLNSSLPSGVGQGVNPAAALHRVEFEHDAWGNLLKAVRRTGLPQQAWRYEYEPVPKLATGYSRWRRVNELREAHYQVSQDTTPPASGDVAFFDQWVAHYTSQGNSKTFEHVDPAEIIDSVTSSGSGPAAYQFFYPAKGQRRVTRPDGVDVVFSLSDYGSATRMKAGALPEQKTQWRADGQISPDVVTLSNQAELKYNIDASHRLTSLFLQKDAVGYRDTLGVKAGEPLVQQTFTHDVNKQFGIPDQRITPTRDGHQAIKTRVTTKGQVEGIAFVNSDGSTALDSGVRSFGTDGSGVLIAETDALGQQTSYSSPNELGLPQLITLTHPHAGSLGLATLTRNVTYDRLGRVVEVTENETGAEEAWQYDGLGRVTRHFIKAEPAQEWTYTYTQGDRRTKMEERLNGSQPLRTVETWEVVDGDPGVRGVFVEESTPFGPPGQAKVAIRKRHIQNGRVVATTDAVGVERAYEYDASGRLTGVRIIAAGTTAGPVGGYESRYQDFDSNGNARVVVDQNGLRTTVGYDVLGRATFWDYTGAETVSGERSSEEYQRDFAGNVLLRAFGNSKSSHVLEHAPDAAGRVRSTKSQGAGVGVHTTVDYDGAGRVVKQHDVVMGTDERFEYHDVLGRLTHYSRTILSSDGPLTLEEERRYEDATAASTGLRKVAISRTIQMVGGQERYEQTEEYYDVAGRLREQVRFIAGERATWKYTYNERGQVRTLVAPTEGQATETTTYHYDSAGNLYRVEEPGDANNPAAITETVVDGEGRVIQQKGPHPDADWRFTYDVFGQLLSKELMATAGSSEGGRWSFAYGVQGKTGGDLTVPDSAVEETDPLGYKTYRFFNARYQILKEVREDAPTVAGGGTSTRKNATTTTYAYAGSWLQKQVRTERTEGTDGPSSVLTVEHTKFDDRGRSLGRSERWQRGADSYEYVTKSQWAGRTVAVLQTGTVSASPEVVLPQRNFTVTTNSLGQAVSRAQGGLTDAWSYDAAGILSKEQPAGRPATRYTYDQGLVVEMALGEGGLTEYTRMTYRLDGRLKSVTDPAHRVRSLFYGPRGLMVRETFGRDGVLTDTKYAYDAGGNVASVAKDPDNPGDAWLYKYGPLGELSSVTPPGLTAFTYGYDGLRRLRSIQRPPGGVPSEYFEYDYLGRTTSRVRGTSNWSTSWVNGVQQVTSPNNSEEAGGNDRDLVETLVDGRGRPVWKTFTPGPSSEPQQDITRLAFAYDASDELVQAHEHRVGRSVLNTFRYDSRGRLVQVRRGKDSESDREDLIEYAYALNADLLKQRFSGVAEVEPLLVQEFEYDLLGRINNIKTRNAEKLASSRIIEWEQGGGQLVRVADASIVERWCYDSRGWLKAVRTTSAIADVDCAQSPISLKIGFHYAYDSRGNRIEEIAQYPNEQGTISSEVTTYGYDKADRLTGVKYPSGNAVLYLLAMDGTRLGERHATNFSGALSESGYGQALQAARRLEYGFDGAGGLKFIDDLTLDGAMRRQASIFTDGSGRVRTEIRSTNKTSDYEWDADGKLRQVRVQKPGASGAQESIVVSYRYGFDGLRRERVVADDTTRYVWNSGELVEEQLGDGTRLHQERIAEVTISVGDLRVLHDGLGSGVGRIKTDGTLTAHRYDAWGNFRDDTAPTSAQASIGYTGHGWDADVGLTYAQQRWLDTHTGRFLSEDPVGAGAYLGTPNGLNPWAYANGNPTRYTDPDGRQGLEPMQPTPAPGSGGGPSGGLSPRAMLPWEQWQKPSTTGGPSAQPLTLPRPWWFTPPTLALWLFFNGPGGSGCTPSATEGCGGFTSEQLDAIARERILYQQELCGNGDRAACAVLTRLGGQLPMFAPGASSALGAVVQEPVRPSPAIKEPALPGPAVQESWSWIDPVVDPTNFDGPFQLSSDGKEEPDPAVGIDVFFRGTTRGYPGNRGNQIMGISPVSTDPLVATLFAAESASHGGEAVVLIATRRDLEGVKFEEGNIFAGLEREFGATIPPLEFEAKAGIKLPLEIARKILKEMGYSMPPKIHGKTMLEERLKSSSRLTSEQIDEFVRKVSEASR
ncbi:DUF6531 domain-containing protein [Myxococcus sp. K38C18041901]|uniref:RHS repeat-associated core domain-containing protein n=1 Tax=Myxococcus guangdongensis TaxID=2906760 RepID=UPI0020A80458|nr:RHS repeat-associated core domain-containing protein [Myxococcus guangdongensis]MCP3060238.1 DUF6531 domain-containing protein [Myxococcus guangdongensis]